LPFLTFIAFQTRLDVYYTPCLVDVVYTLNVTFAPTGCLVTNRAPSLYCLPALPLCVVWILPSSGGPFGAHHTAHLPHRTPSHHTHHAAAATPQVVDAVYYGTIPLPAALRWMDVSVTVGCTFACLLPVTPLAYVCICLFVSRTTHVYRTLRSLPSLTPHLRLDAWFLPAVGCRCDFVVTHHTRCRSLYPRLRLPILGAFPSTLRCHVVRAARSPHCPVPFTAALRCLNAAGYATHSHTTTTSYVLPRYLPSPPWFGSATPPYAHGLPVVAVTLPLPLTVDVACRLHAYGCRVTRPDFRAPTCACRHCATVLVDLPTPSAVCGLLPRLLF